ncbi:uncharacterized protein LOC143051939 [Mytilus galloprovincialis]|uniref:uncharacterized protein LOC143051939 n=1 Tax=Mytilus galloprovincialis TaxID=29158 RepID=UPI003F7BF6A4
MQDHIINEDGNFLVKKYYSDKLESGRTIGTRIISKVYQSNKICHYAVIQYIGDCRNGLRPHGNNLRHELYMRTKQSILDREKSLVTNLPPKQVINSIETENVRFLDDSSPSDSPRDRQQIYNVKKKEQNTQKSRNTGKLKNADFEKLILSMDTSDFVKGVDFSSSKSKDRIHPNTFAATTGHLNWIKKYCSVSSRYKAQLAIDMTYKVGPFYTTCLSLAHPVFVHKDDHLKHPSLFVGMMTTTSRTSSDYQYLSNQLRKHGVNSLIYGTDGEYALEMGFEATFPIEKGKNIHLRCFNHLKEDLEVELKNAKVSNSKQIVKDILGYEIGSIRFNGLVDSHEKDYYKQYNEISHSWTPDFKDYLQSKGFRVRPLMETFIKCMGREVRVNAGLGNPPNKYENQRAESMNSVLKESIGGKFTDQASVHDLVYRKVVLPQERELIKAIYSHGEYRIAKSFKNYEIHPSVWKSMTPEQRQIHVNKIIMPSNISDEEAIFVKLSKEPEELADLLTNIPVYLTMEIWESAEKILSHGKITDVDKESYCVVYKKEAFMVTIKADQFACSCKLFDKMKLCGHVLAAADGKSLLEELLKKRKYSPVLAINRNTSPSAGEKRVKKPRKGSQNVVKQPIQHEVHLPTEINLNIRRPFQMNEIFHNDEPFCIEYLNNITKEVDCASCSCLLSKKALSPYNIAFSHNERYVYPSVEKNGKTVWKPTLKKMGKRYCCVKRECIIKRYPYF